MLPLLLSLFRPGQVDRLNTLVDLAYQGGPHGFRG
jgi:hypothetical protein